MTDNSERSPAPATSKNHLGFRIDGALVIWDAGGRPTPATARDRALWKEIERLMRENATLRSVCKLWGLNEDPEHEANVAKRIAHETTASQDAADAARYRWLKTEDRRRMPLATISWRQRSNGLPCKLADNDPLDALIDAAITAPDASVEQIYKSAVKASGEPTDAEKRAMGVDLDSRDHEAR